jgi:glycosyltransferase involved in cell wall biosynthesis
LNKPLLAIVIPCYNEQEVLPEVSKRLLEKLDSLIERSLVSSDSYICFVDDGSADKTWSMIDELTKSDSKFRGLKLTCNRGHQNALVAGLINCESHCDITISIDADLQDDINAIDEMIKKYHEGFEIVYGVRKKRETDTIFKKWTAQGFYKVMKLFGVNIVYNHADYRLASSKVLKHFNEYKEVNLFLRGIFPTIGYKSSTVEYDRCERFAGESKYPLKKMLSFAVEGITSFSTVPLRLLILLGLVTVCFALLLGVWALYQRMVGNVVPGWSSTIISIYFLGAVQLLSLGLIGEYVGKIYKEVKSRPRFFIETKLGFSKNENT